MIKEFEGKTEKEAIQKAVTELGIEQDQFDVEVIESEQSGFLFKKSNIKIKVHFKADEMIATQDPIEPTEDFEKKLIEFTETTINKMGYPGKVHLVNKDVQKITLSIESEHSGILIGRKGKNIDALQLLVNVFESRINNAKPVRVILDAENYRKRREESLIKMAIKTASMVEKSKSSRLLEPMNPFERRLIHTALNDKTTVITKSEGDGLYKRVRIIYKGSR
jgi:spoIIIJ-associated protein